MIDEKYDRYQRRMDEAGTVEECDVILKDLQQEDQGDSDVADLAEQVFNVRSTKRDTRNPTE